MAFSYRDDPEKYITFFAIFRVVQQICNPYCEGTAAVCSRSAVISVSYTLLDVYKRQVFSGGEVTAQIDFH